MGRGMFPAIAAFLRAARSSMLECDAMRQRPRLPPEPNVSRVGLGSGGWRRLAGGMDVISVHLHMLSCQGNDNVLEADHDRIVSGIKGVRTNDWIRDSLRWICQGPDDGPCYYCLRCATQKAGGRSMRSSDNGMAWTPDQSIGRPAIGDGGGGMPWYATIAGFQRDNRVAVKWLGESKTNQECWIPNPLVYELVQGGVEFDLKWVTGLIDMHRVLWTSKQSGLGSGGLEQTCVGIEKGSPGLGQ